jgi:hypothetical protein
VRVSMPTNFEAGWWCCGGKRQCAAGIGVEVGCVPSRLPVVLSRSRLAFVVLAGAGRPSAAVRPGGSLGTRRRGRASAPDQTDESRRTPDAEGRGRTQAMGRDRCHRSGCHDPPSMVTGLQQQQQAALAAPDAAIEQSRRDEWTSTQTTTAAEKVDEAKRSEVMLCHTVEDKLTAVPHRALEWDRHEAAFHTACPECVRTPSVLLTPAF